MTILEPIRLEDLTDQELEWLGKYAADSWDYTTLREILEEVRDGKMALWRIKSDGSKGLIGTKIFTRGGKTTIWWELIVGEGFMQDIASIRLAMIALAKRAGATSVTGIVERPGLARMYERKVGLKPSAQIFREEF